VSLFCVTEQVFKLLNYVTVSYTASLLTDVITMTVKMQYSHHTHSNATLIVTTIHCTSICTRNICDRRHPALSKIIPVYS